MERIAYFGLDVHKEKNVIHLFTIESETCQVIDVNIGSVIADNRICIKAIKNTIEKYHLESYKIQIGYEAGPTGFSLCKDLNREGFCCDVIAPSSIPKAPGDKVKTDRIDAAAIAHLLSTGSYKKVYMLNEEDYCVREVARQQTDTKRHAADIRRKIKMFLLRNNKSFEDGCDNWTQRYRSWLEKLDFGNEHLNYAFKNLLHNLYVAEEEIEQLNAYLDNIAKGKRYKERVDKLICFAGIDKQIALSLCCEIGDFSRFEKASDFASYLGLAPGQDSSGKRVKYTCITKCGNQHLRTLLTESSKAIYLSNQNKKSKKIMLKQKGKDLLVIAYADRGSKRIHDKMYKMRNFKGKNANIATIAGARELACFIWGMMTGNISRGNKVKKQFDFAVKQSY